MSWLNANWQGIVAIIAMIATGIQAWAARQQNHHSVVPVLVMNFGHGIDGCIRCSMENRGNGPAFVDSVSVETTDGRLMRGSQASSFFLRTLDTLLFEQEGMITTSDLGGGLVIGVGQELNFWRISGEVPQSKQEEIRRFFLNLKFSVNYSSLTKQKFSYSSRRVEVLSL